MLTGHCLVCHVWNNAQKVSYHYTIKQRHALGINQHKLVQAGLKNRDWKSTSRCSHNYHEDASLGGLYIPLRCTIKSPFHPDNLRPSAVLWRNLTGRCNVQNPYISTVYLHRISPPYISTVYLHCLLSWPWDRGESFCCEIRLCWYFRYFIDISVKQVLSLNWQDTWLVGSMPSVRKKRAQNKRNYRLRKRKYYRSATC